MLTASMLLLSIIPFGFKKWQRNREFNKIRKEIMALTGGEDSGFTRERYRENRDDVFTSYFLPILCLLSASMTALPFGESMMEMVHTLLFIFGFSMSIIFLNHFL